MQLFFDKTNITYLSRRIFVAGCIRSRYNVPRDRGNGRPVCPWKPYTTGNQGQKSC